MWLGFKAAVTYARGLTLVSLNFARSGGGYLECEVVQVPRLLLSLNMRMHGAGEDLIVGTA